MSCPDCFRGGVSASHPTGTETTVHGLPTYVAQPEDGITPKGIIVMITDAFGWKFVNNRVLCDHYAKRGGYLVYCPDFMNGNALDPSAIGIMDKIMEPSPLSTTVFYKPVYVFQAMALAMPWKIKARISVTHAPVVSFFQAIRTSPSPFPTENLKVAAAGFCWGGKHTLLLAQDNPSSRVVRHESQTDHTTTLPLLDCAFTAHPSYLEFPNDIEAITIPISIAVGDEDMALKAPVAQEVKEMLEGKEEAGHQVNIIPGAKHGFAVRNHPGDVHEKECADKAETQAIDWFTRWLS